MAEITAAMVRELRDRTDAPMMECKKALTEAGGDLAKAEEILRIKLGNKASKASARVTAEGVVAAFVSPDGRTGVILEVNCETDFVAKNEDFLGFAQRAAELVAAQQSRGRGGTVGARHSTARRLKRCARRWSEKSAKTFRCGASRVWRRPVGSRLTSTAARGSACSIDVTGGDEALAKDLAMHIAAIKPVALSRRPDTG